MAQSNLQARVASARPARASGSGVGQARAVYRPPAIGPAHPAGSAIGLSQAQPVGGARASSSPAAPPAPATPPVGIAWDAQAEREAGGALHNFQDTEAGILGSWQAYQARLGGNPYSQADLLQAEHAYWAGGDNTTLSGLMRNRDTGYRGAVNGAGLGLYSGATAGRRFRTGTGYLSSLGGVQRDFTIAATGKEREEAAAKHSLEDAINQIKEEALIRRAEQEAPPEPAPSGGGGGGGGSGPGQTATITVVNPKTGKKEKKKIGISSNKAVR